MEEKTSPTIKNRQDKNKKNIIEQLRAVPIIEIVCKKTGIGRSTFYRWKTEDPKFADEVNSAIEQGVSVISDLAESKLISAIKDQNMTGIIFWLKHHHKNYTTRVELSGKIKTECEDLTPEQQQLIMKALELASIKDPKTHESRSEPKTDQ
ncbi:hypothetical protein HQ544_01595 [Candidatus Falkowbacteria bacterium]|nr:hypothetical protein [Candidatus Falkowbacteria bacterium]